MYQKLLAPLDGSDLAECALSHVKTIAMGCKVAEVVLIGVVEPMLSVSALNAELGREWVSNAQKGMRKASEEYLTKVAEKLKKDGINAKVVVSEGLAADKILEYATRNKVDLIIMSSHGRSGVARWTFGSVADRVVRHATVPVLLAAAPACRVD